MTPHDKIPAIVLALAAAVPQLGPLAPRPIAWKEYPGEWVVVFEDGRKLRFAEAAPQERRPAPATSTRRKERS